MQAADHLGAGLAQIPVMLGPYLQNRGVIIGPDFPDAGRAQRGHGTDRASLGAFLSCHQRQQPDPGAQLGLHIQHPLTRG